MSLVSRALRDIARKRARTGAAVLIVGLSLGVFLTLSVVNANIAAQAQNASEAVDSTVTVRPAGSFGFFSNSTIDPAIVSTVAATDHVSYVQPVVLAREASAPQPGGPDGGGAGGFRGRGFNLVLVQGEDPAHPLVLFGGGTVALSQGRLLEAADQGQRVALVGSDYASNHAVGVGDSIALNGTALTVVGIFGGGSGNRFAGSSVLVSNTTAEAIYNVTGAAMLYVRVDSPGNVANVTAALNATLGSEYDVVPASQTQGEALQNAVNSIQSSSEFGALSSLITGMAVLAFAMAWAARERMPEIGIMKAIGFGNGRILAQFLLEAVVLVTVGFVVSLLIMTLMGPSIAALFAGGSTQAAAAPTGPRGFQGGGGNFPGFGGAIQSGLVSNLDYTLSAGVLVVTLAAGMAMAVAGSLVPIIKAVRMRPAEALRYE